jgi:hypothetical protein
MIFHLIDDCITAISRILHGVFGCLDIHGWSGIVGMGQKVF